MKGPTCQINNTFISGGIAGMLSWLIPYPIDTIKSRIQMGYSLKESIKFFDLKGVGKSPSKLDMTRILSLNEHYIKNMDEKKLFQFLKDYCQKFKKKIDESKENSLIKSINFLKNKAKTLEDIYKNSQYILQDSIQISQEDSKLLVSNSYQKKITSNIVKAVKNYFDWIENNN